MSTAAIHPQTRMGHVHLRVADLDRALAFYHGVLGFDITQHFGNSAAFLSAGGYHHHIGLNTWESLGGSPPPAGTTGLYHLAVLYPTRAALADALQRLISANIPLDGAADHGVSEALYLRDPDNNGPPRTPMAQRRPRQLGHVLPRARPKSHPSRSQILENFHGRTAKTCPRCIQMTVISTGAKRPRRLA
jgi:catechol 2,3-dioxygenase